MVFTKVGRMSLPCYLLNSIIGTMLFLKDRALFSTLG
ncbi:DUF418 domain-containing protein [Bacillus sp. ms-22]|nr:DUF418 domain-containing protein [Bacillus sp. ms-22]